MSLPPEKRRSRAGNDDCVDPSNRPGPPNGIRVAAQPPGSCTGLLLALVGLAGHQPTGTPFVGVGARRQARSLPAPALMAAPASAFNGTRALDGSAAPLLLPSRRAAAAASCFRTTGERRLGAAALLVSGTLKRARLWRSCRRRTVRGLAVRRGRCHGCETRWRWRSRPPAGTTTLTTTQ